MDMVVFRLCFTKLKILLIAVEIKSADGFTNIAINPGPDAKVEAGTQGFFIAQSDEEAKRYLIGWLSVPDCD